LYLSHLVVLILLSIAAQPYSHTAKKKARWGYFLSFMIDSVEVNPFYHGEKQPILLHFTPVFDVKYAVLARPKEQAGRKNRPGRQASISIVRRGGIIICNRNKE